MALLALLALLGLLSGCAGTFLDVSTGPAINPITGGSSNWEGSGPIVELAVRQEWKAWFCQYAHTSNLLSGPPFNNDRETTLDRVTCGRSIELRCVLAAC